MWCALDKHEVLMKYVGLIKDMYNNVVTRVRTSDGDTDDFPIRIGLHQGSASMFLRRRFGVALASPNRQGAPGQTIWQTTRLKFVWRPP